MLLPYMGRNWHLNLQKKGPPVSSVECICFARLSNLTLHCIYKKFSDMTMKLFLDLG